MALESHPQNIPLHLCGCVLRLYPSRLAYTPFRIVITIECVLSSSISCPAVGYLEKVLLKEDSNMGTTALLQRTSTPLGAIYE
jgi:hypothetical protein